MSSPVQYIFPLQYTQETTGSNLVLGYPLSGYTRLFTGYSYELIKVYDINPLYLDPAVLAGSPYLRESLMLDQNGRRIVSKISPSVVFNTVNQPIFPTAGKRLTRLSRLCRGRWEHQLHPDPARGHLVSAGDGAHDVGHSRRIAVRPAVRIDASRCPIFEKFFLGGEYSMRGFDIRSVGPRDAINPAIVTGGNKTLLFNAEYYINVGGPVRLLGFFDAGQVQDIGQTFKWYEPVLELVTRDLPLLTDVFTSPDLRDAAWRGPDAEVPRHRRDVRVQDVDRTRSPVLHAGVERAVPLDRGLQPVAARRPQQQPAADAEVHVPVRGGDHVLRTMTARGERSEPCWAPAHGWSGAEPSRECEVASAAGGAPCAH